MLGLKSRKNDTLGCWLPRRDFHFMLTYKRTLSHTVRLFVGDVLSLLDMSHLCTISYHKAGDETERMQ